jgi:hypothetical protein
MFGTKLQKPYSAPLRHCQRYGYFGNVLNIRNFGNRWWHFQELFMTPRGLCNMNQIQQIMHIINWRLHHRHNVLWPQRVASHSVGDLASDGDDVLYMSHGGCAAYDSWHNIMRFIACINFAINQIYVQALMKFYDLSVWLVIRWVTWQSTMMTCCTWATGMALLMNTNNANTFEWKWKMILSPCVNHW